MAQETLTFSRNTPAVARHQTGPEHMRHASAPDQLISKALANLNLLARKPAAATKPVERREERLATAPKHQGVPFCSAPWTIGWITEHGNVQHCCRLSASTSLEQAGSLKAVWHGDEWVDFRKKVARGEYPSDRCRQCREAATYQTLGKDFSGVPQGYLAQLASQSLTPEENSLRHRLAAFFNGYDFTKFVLPEPMLEGMEQLLHDGREWQQRCPTGNPLVRKLFTALQVFHDLYTRNPYPEIVMPFRIPVMATRCNARCIMCCMVVDGDIERGTFMSDSLLAKSFESPDNIIKTWTAATEILLHPRWRDIIHTLHGADVHLAISTNGMPLTESASQFLVDNRLKQLGFSINGATKETFEAIMQRVSFERFKTNVRYFTDYNRSQGSPTSVGFTMVALRRNLPELPNLIRLVHELAGPGSGLHVSSLEAPGSDRQREFYMREHPRNLPREQLVSIFKESSSVARELGLRVSCFYYKNMDDVIGDLNNIPQVTW